MMSKKRRYWKTVYLKLCKAIIKTRSNPSQRDRKGKEEVICSISKPKLGHFSSLWFGRRGSKSRGFI